MAPNKSATDTQYLVAFLGFGSFRNNLRYVRDNEPHLERAYLPRALFGGFLGFITTLTGLPMRIYEHVRYGERVNALEIKKPPIFIIGHWRSGTTFLHNLMSQDRAFGYVSLFQTIAHDLYLVGDRIVKPLVAALLPRRRPMDNVIFDLDHPEEEEHTIARLSPYSFYHQWSFPRKGREYFEKYALFQNIPQSVLSEWKEIYLGILRKATMKMGGRRLILKNPVNTVRIEVLLELFPNAKFIHIYRNPYRVFQSTRRLYDKSLSITQLQDISQAEIDANILYFYQVMMNKYLTDRSLIPSENLVELRFEDLDAEPLTQLERIYRQLDLPGFAEAEVGFRRYLDSQRNYQKNRYQTDTQIIQLVNQHWYFAFEKLGYEMVQPEN